MTANLYFLIILRGSGSALRNFSGCHRSGFLSFKKVVVKCKCFERAYRTSFFLTLSGSRTSRQARRAARTWPRPWRACWIWSWSAWRGVWTDHGSLTAPCALMGTAAAIWSNRQHRRRASVPASGQTVPLRHLIMKHPLRFAHKRRARVATSGQTAPLHTSYAVIEHLAGFHLYALYSNQARGFPKRITDLHQSE